MPDPQSPAALLQHQAPCQKRVSAAEGPRDPASSWQADGLKKGLACLCEHKVFWIKRRRPGSHTSMMLTDGILLLLLLFLGNCGKREMDDRYKKTGEFTGIIQKASSVSVRMPLYSDVLLILIERINKDLFWLLCFALVWTQQMNMVWGSEHWS